MMHGVFYLIYILSVCVIFEGGFGSSAGIAGAQGFQSHGPMGGNNYLIIIHLLIF